MKENAREEIIESAVKLALRFLYHSPGCTGRLSVEQRCLAAHIKFDAKRQNISIFYLIMMPSDRMLKRDKKYLPDLKLVQNFLMA